MTTRSAVHIAGTANVHGNPHGVRVMLAQGCHTLTLDEVYQPPIRRLLGGLRGYRVWSTPYGRDLRRGPHDAPILWSKRLDTLGVLGIRSSEATSPVKIAPDRYVHAVIVDGPLGVTAHAGIHPNPVGKAYDNPRAPRIRANDEASDTLDRILTLLEGEADHVIVSGDSNSRPGSPSRGWQDVYHVLAAHHMDYATTGLDVIAWGPTLVAAGAPTIHSRAELRSDHDGITQALRKRAHR